MIGEKTQHTYFDLFVLIGNEDNDRKKWIRCISKNEIVIDCSDGIPSVILRLKTQLFYFSLSESDFTIDGVYKFPERAVIDWGG